MDYNPFDAEVRKNPYPYYAELREEHPVYSLEALSAFVISRYDDVSFVVNNPAIFSSDALGTTNIDGRETKMLVSVDPPDHTRLRGLVNRAFTPKMIADLEPRIREVVAELLDDVTPHGKMDLVEDLAIPLPVTIIAEFLGVPAEDKADFKRWSSSLASNMVSQGQDEQHETEMEAFIAYFKNAIEQRRQEPKEDMLSLLVQAEGEDALTADEVIAFAILLLFAGNETTTNLIGNAMRALLNHPDQLEQVREDRSLVPNFVEEALRYDAPVQFLFRRTTEDVEIAGTAIPKDSMVLPIFGAANRDVRKFPDGERFDITRNTQGHMAFGHGIHFCLGAPLARLESTIVVEAILSRLDNLQHAGGNVEFIDSPFLRGPKHLQLTFEPVAEAVEA
jgi:cytochrome P450